MKKLFAGAIAAGVVGSAGALGCGVAAADPAADPATDPATDSATVYAVGGARPPGIPWHRYTDWSGREYYPNENRVIVDYPGGAIPTDLAAAFGTDVWTPDVGTSVAAGTRSLDSALDSANGPAVSLGLSEGTLVQHEEQIKLANSPTAPPPDQLSFAMFSSPVVEHGWGKSIMATIIPPGTFVPFLNYTMPAPVESQYDTTVVAGAYDGIADFPDRTDNLVSVANALVGGGTVHTPIAFTSPEDVPPGNIKTTVNSRGGKTTTYLVPSKYLPLTWPLHEVGVPDDITNQLNAVLTPMVDAGYSRNDDPSTRPINLDPTAPDVISDLLQDPALAPDTLMQQIGDVFLVPDPALAPDAWVQEIGDVDLLQDPALAPDALVQQIGDVFGGIG